MSVAVISASGAGLRLFSRLLVGSVLLLIFVGALVTSHQAGLSVPDWPTTYGENMFLFPYHKWQGGVFYEHGHRLLASVIGMLTVVLFCWTLLVEARSWVRWLSGVAVAAVVLQGVLGGLTVLYLLPAWLSTAHAVLAQSFLCITAILAYAHSYEGNSFVAAVSASRRRVRKLAAIGAGLVFLQLVVGAYMRHTSSGLAIPDFPTMGGAWLPGFDGQMLQNINARLRELGQWTVSMDQVYIHAAHRLGGVFIAVYTLWFCLTALRASALPVMLHRHCYGLLALVGLQFLLGVGAVLTVKEPFLTSVHVIGGAVLLLAYVLLVVRNENGVVR